MNKPLTLGSLFDGSGGFPLAGLLAGIVPVWSSEIEPFAIRVTEKRLPQVQHFGNISGLHGAKLPPVDIITFGSPCQDMSIAGKRTGLNGSRSSLFHEAIRIIREMRCASNGKYPRYIVWENVPGVLSSKDNASGSTISNKTAAELGKLPAWNKGKDADAGTFGKLRQPYDAAKPGKLAYLMQYRQSLATGLP